MTDPTTPASTGQNPLKDPRQERFALEYLVDLNATQAAIRAGYTARSSRTTAARLLANDNIQARVQALKDERATRTKVTADRVVAELAAVAFARLSDVVTWDADGVTVLASADLSGDAVASVQSVKMKKTTTSGDWGEREVVEVEVKQWPKVDALEKLGRHLGIFKQDEASGPLAVTITRQVVGAPLDLDDL